MTIQRLLTEDDFDKALALAYEHHTGQKYGEHDYFQFHVKGVFDKVLEIVEEAAPDQTLLLAATVAVLHDTVEDTDLTLDQIEKEFGNEVMVAVECLTKEDGYDYNDYVKRIRNNPIAKIVKTADAIFNLQESCACGHAGRVAKYTKLIGDLYTEC